jgi:hypothetical protein
MKSIKKINPRIWDISSGLLIIFVNHAYMHTYFQGHESNTDAFQGHKLWVIVMCSKFRKRGSFSSLLCAVSSLRQFS